jgi:hypothetical protein
MEGASRTRLVALAVLLAVSVPLVIVAASGSGDGGEERPAGLRVEQTAGGLAEITVYVEDRSLNAPETAGGAPTVTVECVDGSGRVVFSEPERWPFTDTDDGTLDPHAHMGMNEELVERIARCRLEGTDPRLEGRRL